MPPTPAHKESLSSLGSNRSSSSLSGSGSYYRNLQESAEETESESGLRVGTWCCEGVAGQSDSLDIILFNDGSPMDIMLLQATQQPCPHIEGYQFVESAAPEYDPSAGVAIYWRDLTVRGNTEKFESELPGRIIKINLTWRDTKVNFNVVNFHGFSFGKKGNRSKIELLELLRERNGLDRKKRNILGGNFNFVEQIQDRKREGAEEAFNREQQVRDFFVNLSKKFKLKETFAREYKEQYQSGTVKVPLSHNGVARTDRIYLSDEILEDFTTATCYIDNSGSNDHCIVEITSSPAEKDSDFVRTDLSPQVYRGEDTNISNTTTPMAAPSTRTMERLDVVMENMMEMMRKQEADLENIKSTLKDIKQRI